MRGARVADVIIGGWLGGLGWTGSSMLAVRQVASCDARCAVRRDKSENRGKKAWRAGTGFRVMRLFGLWIENKIAVGQNI
jgi:hypothetical protein